MPKRSHKNSKASSAKLKELVVVAVIDDPEQACDYETLLRSNDIPATIRQQKDDPLDIVRYAIMVPEEYADEAGVIIESQDAYDDFYDFAVDDDEEDFELDFFDGEY
jgi:hypothetical protein